jgi:hypothetical protein
LVSFRVVIRIKLIENLKSVAGPTPNDGENPALITLSTYSSLVYHYFDLKFPYQTSPTIRYITPYFSVLNGITELNLDMPWGIFHSTHEFVVSLLKALVSYLLSKAQELHLRNDQ